MERIEIRNLTKRYGRATALDGISTVFEKDRIYGLLGRNGAGKTTLLSILSNRIFADEGEVIFEGRKEAKVSEYGEIYCTTEKALYPENMKIKELIRWTHEFYCSFDKDRALELCDSFNLKLNLRVKGLSTGYATIAKNIMALASNTPLLLLDEPVLGLDANHRELFYREMLRSYSEFPRTIIVSTHLIEEIDGVIEQAVILDKGKILLKDEIDNIVEKAYMVSGPKDMVDKFAEGKNVIGSELLGGLKTAYIFDEKQPDCAEGNKALEISRISLQKLFIHLTNGGVR